MSETATLRWGDVQNIVLTPTVAQEGTNVLPVTRQLVAANWPVPMSWNVLIFAVPNINLLDNGTWNVNWLFSLGAGQSASTSVPLFTMGPFTNAQNGKCTQQQQLVPSSNLQIQAQVIGNFGTTNPESIYVGAFVAPNNAEPFGDKELMRMMTGEADPSQEKPWMRWMPMGFYGDLDPLKYGPRR